MADGVTDTSVEPELPQAEPEPISDQELAASPDPATAMGGGPAGPGEPIIKHRAPHADRFRVALAVLAGVGLGAIVFALAVLGGHHTSRSATAMQWSSWAPSGSGTTAVQEIADEIAPYYRLDAATQLDVVSPIQLTDATEAGVTTGNGLTVAVDTGTSSSTASTSGAASLALLGGKTVGFNICGSGTSNCALPGKASTNRMMLLRREALQLALYTFKYVPSAENVLVVLPPGRTVSSSKTAASKTSTALTVAVLFLRSELKPWLQIPADETLQTIPPDVAELSSWIQSEEAGLVDEITGKGLFAEQVESQQEGGNLIVLTPLPDS